MPSHASRVTKRDAQEVQERYEQLASIPFGGIIQAITSLGNLWYHDRVMKRPPVVIALLKLGWTNAEVAKYLDISQRTVNIDMGRYGFDRKAAPEAYLRWRINRQDARGYSVDHIAIRYDLDIGKVIDILDHLPRGTKKAYEARIQAALGSQAQIDNIVAKVYKQTGTLKATARATGFSIYTVNKTLIRLGLKKYNAPKFTPAQREAITEMLKRGDSNKEVARRFECDPARIQRFRYQYGPFTEADRRTPTKYAPITPELAERIEDALADGWPYSEIAATFNVSLSAVSRRWPHRGLSPSDAIHYGMSKRILDRLEAA